MALPPLFLRGAVMPKRSAGIILYRLAGDRLQVFLCHPGGPFWKNRDAHAWSFPKGEFDDEAPFDAARREFEEETGKRANGPFLALTPCKQSGGKLVHAWAVEGDIDETAIVSNEFEMEWPPKSGRTRRFPEIDRGAWFDIDEARERIHKGLIPMLDELASALA